MNQAQRIDRAIDEAIEDTRLVGAVVLVAQGGQTIYARAAGYADRESKRAMRDDAIFRLASVTKPIVSAAAMRLVEQGKLALDMKVTGFLPDFVPRLADGSAPPIEIHHLLTHTAGLSYRFAEPADSAYHVHDVCDGLDQPGLSMAENLTRLARAPLVFAPGTNWRYSLATDVLGAVLEKAGDAALPDLVQKLIGEEFGFADTGFKVTDKARLAVPYANAKPEPVPIKDGMTLPLFEGTLRFAPSRIFDPKSYPSGGGGMAGTAPELLRFFDALHGKRAILKPDTLDAMFRDRLASHVDRPRPGWGFGYGGAVLINPKAADTPQAKGTLGWGGVYGHAWFVDRANALSVVALTNTAFEGMAGAFTIELRDAIYG
jgi:CubicO group peptidase (beta-lactamase class C family)